MKKKTITEIMKLVVQLNNLKKKLKINNFYTIQVFI